MSVHAVRKSASRVPLWARIVGAGAALALVLVAFNATRETALAAPFSVNNTADSADQNPGDGICDSGGGICTLRAAIQEANANGEADIITLPAGTYTLAVGAAGDDFAASGDLDITEDLTIVGAGAGLTIIDAAGLDRAFHVHGATVTFTGITVTNGLAGAGGGGAILSSAASITVNFSEFVGNQAPGTDPTGVGGAIFGSFAGGVGSTVTVFRSTFNDNQAGYAGGAISTSGGGLELGTAGSDLTVIESTFDGNIGALGGGALYPNGPSTLVEGSTFSSNLSPVRGGAIHNNGDVTTIVNSTFFNNQSGIGGAGAVDNRIGDLTVQNSTFVDNSAAFADSLSQDDFGLPSASLTVANSILWSVTPNSCEGTITDGGGNLEFPDGDCPADTAGDPLLGPLGDNGGPTQTFRLESTSPAVDAADPGACGPTDQRGGRRPVDGDGDGTAVCDIGAYELGFVVTSALDPVPGPADGFCPLAACSLREAITEANAAPGFDYITFDILAGGPVTISPASSLPTINDPLFIDGASQPDAVCSADTFVGRNLLVVIAGGDMAVDGLTVSATADGSTIRGLSIGGFLNPSPDAPVAGLRVSADNVTVECNHLGASAGGNTATPNRVGLIVGSSVSGGTVRGNVLSGNSGTGVRVQFATNVVLTNNRIGMGANGDTPVANGIFGLRVLSATDTLVGGDNGLSPGGACTGDCNLISGNDASDGVYIDSTSPGTIIRNNFIGTDVTGMLDRGNSADGITLEDGVTATIEGNLISGNDNDGIHYIDVPAVPGIPAVTIRGNKIGTNTAGTAALENATHGIHITGARGITIGGPAPADRNIISGNGQSAVFACGLDCVTPGAVPLGLTVEGNYIGINAAGTALISNGGFATLSFDDVDSAIVRGNVVASSAGFAGIWFQDSHNPTVEDNYVGLNAGGTAVLGVSANGIVIDTTTGGMVTGNTVAGAAGDGIQLFDGTSGALVQANSVGTNAGQNAALGNGGHGISVVSATTTGNLIYTNLIVGSGGDGIHIDGAMSTVVAEGNLIGAIPGSVTTAAPNANGIRVVNNACGTVLGSFAVGGANTIVGNTGWGVIIENAACASLPNEVLSHRIGIVQTFPATTIPNGLGGVLVQDSSGVNVGSVSPLSTNIITGNNGPGVRVAGASSNANIQDKAIYANSGFLGIDLVAAGDTPADFRTANDPTDNDSGPNGLQNTPVITSVTVGEGNLTIDGTLPGGAGVTTYHFYATDQFLPGAACSTANPASSVGQRFLGSAGSNGDTFSILLAAATVGDNEYVTATATGATGTSEFSPCFVVGAGGGAGLTASIFADASAVQAGASIVPIGDIPLAALSDLPDAVQGVPISAIDIDSSPISAIPISAIPISAITVNGTPISAIPISAIPISAIPISAISTWEGVLDGSALEGVPLQSVTLEQVLADPVAGPRVLNAPISAIELFSTSLRNVSITSVLLGSTPISAIANTNTWLCPSETSLCTNGSTLMAAEIGGLPISAIPISAIPISAIPISAIPLAGTPISAIDPNSSPISAIDLNSIPISAIPISAIPISAIPISAIPISAIPISAIGVGGAPISAIPISAIATPTGQTFCDYAASLGEPCGNATTVAQFVGIHGADSQTLATTPISAIPISAIQGLTGFFDSLAWLIGIDTVGQLYDEGGHLGTMTIGQLVVLVLEAQNYPWEELPLDKVDLQAELSTSPVLNYTVEHMLATGTNYAASISVTLPRGFLYKKGSATVDAVTVPDPVIAGSVLNFNVAGLTAGVTHELSFDAFSSLSTGSAFAIATVSAEGENVTTVSGTVVVTEAFEPANNQPTGGPFVEGDNLYLSHIGSADDVDYYQVPSVAAGSRIGVYLSQLGVDMDLVMYTGNQLPINSTSIIDRATAPQTLPVADQGAGVVREDQFIEPQTLQDIAIQSLPIKATSALRGTADETIESVALRDNEGPYFVAVRSYNRAVTNAPYVLRVRVTPPPPVEVCPAPAFPFPNDFAQVALDGYDAADANTVIVVNRERLAKTYGQAETDSLITKLNEFANATALDVRAKMVDVSGVDYSAFDGNRCDPVAANGVVTAISAQTLAAVGTSGAVKHLVIVGGDEMVPMARIPDLTRISNERDYRLDLVDLKGGAFGAAASGHYLSDDPYGDFDPIPWLERFLYVPDVGIGRLVETPDDIEFALNAFIASGGALNPQTAVVGEPNQGPDSYSVSGYDFLADGATEVDQILADHFWAGGPSLFRLISELWNAGDLLALLAEGASVNSINAHFDHFRLLPADQDEAGLSEELVTTAEVETLLLNTSFAGKLIFSMGCHSGLNISDLLGNSTNAGRTVDWAQTFVGHGAVLIGNTGYGYGDTESVALSERLMALFAKRMDGSITAAQALTFAKQDYYSTLGLYGVYDEKALMQATYYGLPMYRVHQGAVPPAIPTPAELPAAPAPDGGIAGTSSAQVTVSPESTRVDTTAGSYWTANPSTYTQGTASVTIDEVGTQVTHYQPIQPRLSFDVTDHANGLVAHGALITSLATGGADLGINPVYARPVVDSSGEVELSSGDAVFPARLQAISSYNAPDGPRQNLVLVTGQFLPDGDPATDNGAQRLYSSIGAKVYYSSSNDFFAPDILRAEGIINGGNVTFTVETRDRDATGLPSGTVRLVNVLFRDADCATGCGNFAFQPLNLTHIGSGVWTGTVAANGADRFEFLVQAVDSAGNVGVSTSKGVLFLTVTLPPAAVILAGPSDPTTSTAASFSFGTVTPPLSPVGFECSLDGGTFTPCEAPAFYPLLQNGDHEFSVRAVNAAGAGPQADFEWTIAATAPGVAADAVAPSPVGTTITVTGTASAQPSGAAINKIEYSVNGGAYQPGPPIVQGTSTTFSIPFASPGTPQMQEVCVRARDVRGTLSQPTCVLIAWFDVTAGFATGNLKLASEAGAYALDPGLTGPASLNLNTKYKKNSTTPEGDTTFSLPAAGLEFVSTSYDWLVISGNLVQLRASGTINGTGNYQILVSARDNGNKSPKTDTVRIKILDTVSGTVVYDNQPGQPDTAEPVVVITGGNLVVHNK